ncbi:hypothetical protein Tco_0519591 [Tanacetum coccineum]
MKYHPPPLNRGTITLEYSKQPSNSYGVFKLIRLFRDIEDTRSLNTRAILVVSLSHSLPLDEFRFLTWSLVLDL